MADIEFRAFLPFVLPDVQGCSDIAAVNAIRNASIEFCERTLVWTFPYGPEHAYAGEPEYYAGCPGNAVVHAILALRYQDRDLDVAASQQVGTAPGVPRAFVAGSSGRFMLFPTPQDGAMNALTGLLALKPKRDAIDADEGLFQDWAEDIGAGAKARLMATPGKRWTEPTYALKYRSDFLQGIGKAKIRVNKGHAAAATAVQMRPFA